MSSPTKTRAVIGALSRSRRDDDPELVSARKQLIVDNLVEHVTEVAVACPPLSPEQRDAILAAFAGFRVAT